MPIRRAIRASVSIPLVLCPYEEMNDMYRREVYVDGGLVDNFPLHIFDGTRLSLDPKDSFFKVIAENLRDTGTGAAAARAIENANHIRDNVMSPDERTLGFLLLTQREIDESTQFTRCLHFHRFVDSLGVEERSTLTESGRLAIPRGSKLGKAYWEECEERKTNRRRYKRTRTHLCMLMEAILRHQDTEWFKMLAIGGGMSRRNAAEIWQNEAVSNTCDCERRNVRAPPSCPLPFR